MSLFIYVTSFLFGAIVGSFLNVCIYRLPKEESILWPGSHCIHCKKEIKAYDNIPLFSYFLLRGKCRQCQGSISIQYPLVEGATALISLFLMMKYGISWRYLIDFLFVSSLIVITVIDLYHQIIPDIISLPGIGVGLLLSILLPSSTLSFVQSLFGILLGGGSLFLVAVAYQWFIKREGMGGGDVKLLAMIGGFLGWKAVIVTIILSSFIGSITGMVLIAFKGKSFKYAIPFGPFLSLGAVIALFYQNELISWYIHFMRG